MRLRNNGINLQTTMIVCCENGRMLSSSPRVAAKIYLLDSDEETVALSKRLEATGRGCLAVQCRRRSENCELRWNFELGEWEKNC
mmetsp:Transcript_32695/g.75252  ORF Transcript_32695/g.75252 Transcript_32695/m.75252 type:complete len:85 (+) Transcript_32695:447-701(+)